MPKLPSSSCSSLPFLSPLLSLSSPDLIPPAYALCCAPPTATTSPSAHRAPPPTALAAPLPRPPPPPPPTAPLPWPPPRLPPPATSAARAARCCPNGCGGCTARVLLVAVDQNLGIDGFDADEAKRLPPLPIAPLPRLPPRLPPPAASRSCLRPLLAAADEAKQLVLLSLACSSPNPGTRPTMPQVLLIVPKSMPPPEVPSFLWSPEGKRTSS